MRAMGEGMALDRARRVASLSPRQREVLELVALGLTNGEIASRLRVSIHAVKFHLAAVYRELEVTNRTEASVLHVAAANVTETATQNVAGGG